MLLIFFLSLVFVALSVVQLVITVIGYYSGWMQTGVFWQRLDGIAKNLRTNRKSKLIALIAVWLQIALLVVYATPAPVSFAYFFCTILSGLLYCSKLQKPIAQYLLWIPTLPYLMLATMFAPKE